MFPLLLLPPSHTQKKERGLYYRNISGEDAIIFAAMVFPRMNLLMSPSLEILLGPACSVEQYTSSKRAILLLLHGAQTRYDKSRKAPLRFALDLDWDLASPGLIEKDLKHVTLEDRRVL